MVNTWSTLTAVELSKAARTRSSSFVRAFSAIGCVWTYPCPVFPRAPAQPVLQAAALEIASGPTQRHDDGQ